MYQYFGKSAPFIVLAFLALLDGCKRKLYRPLKILFLRSGGLLRGIWQTKKSSEILEAEFQAYYQPISNVFDN